MFQDLRGERLLAGEIRVERPLRDPGRVGDVLDAAGGESACVHEFEPRREQAAAHVEIGRTGHDPDNSRPVSYPEKGGARTARPTRSLSRELGAIRPAAACSVAPSSTARA